MLLRGLLFVFILIFVIMLTPYEGRAYSDSENSNVSVFVPTSAWLVGPATLMTETSLKVPCVMMNQYNNGFSLRFSAGNNKIYAVAIDFRKDIFDVGERYDVSLSVPERYDEAFSAVAHSKNTILINTKEFDGLYDAVNNGKFLGFGMGETVLGFALLGANDGLRRVEQCYNPALQEGDVGDSITHEAKTRPGMGYHDVSPEYSSRVIGEGDKSSNESHSPLPPESKTMLDAQDTAQKLSALNKMMENAANTLSSLEPSAGTAQGQMNAAQQKTIVVTPETSAKQAQSVNTETVEPIGRPLANSWLSPLVRRNKEGIKQKEIVDNPTANYVNSPNYAEHQQRQWRVVKGTNLKKVLDVWTRSANVKLVWQVNDEYLIKRSVSKKSTFEQAVTELLDQQHDETRRPYGRIYTDSTTGQKVLLIQTKS